MINVIVGEVWMFHFEKLGQTHRAPRGLSALLHTDSVQWTYMKTDNRPGGIITYQMVWRQLML